MVHEFQHVFISLDVAVDVPRWVFLTVPKSWIRFADICCVAVGVLDHVQIGRMPVIAAGTTKETRNQHIS